MNCFFISRVWYLASGDKFWLNAGLRQQLAFRDYLPGRDNGISAAVTQLNEDMRTKPIAGTSTTHTFHFSEDGIGQILLMYLLLFLKSIPMIF